MKLSCFSSLLSIFLIMSCSSSDDEGSNDPGNQTLDCTNTASIFAINLDASGCNVNIENQLGATSV